MDKKQIRKLNPERYGPIIDKIDAGICPFCEQPTTPETITSDDAKEEYELTGMCENCFNNFGRDMLEAAKQGNIEATAEIFFSRRGKEEREK